MLNQFISAQSMYSTEVQEIFLETKRKELKIVQVKDLQGFHGHQSTAEY